MIRNQAGQVITAALINRTTGVAVTTGTTSVEVLGDGGTKAAGAGSVENEGGGTWSYFPTQAETDYAAVTFSFTHVDAINVDVQVHTEIGTVTPAPSAPITGSVPFGLDGPVVEVGISGTVPPPHKVLAGVVYGPGDLLIGTAPESNKSHISELVRGDDYSSASTQITTLVADPGDLGLLASCSAVFAGYNAQHRTGWQVTGGTVEDVGAGILRLRSSLVSADTIPCKPDCNYKWTHTLVDASGEIRTQKHGVTKLVDGYAVDRYVD